MSETGKIPHVVISDREPGLPYSKGLMASQVMVSGLSPFRAYQVAERIEERLFDALIDPARLEGTSVISEGAHVVPGFFDLESRKDQILAVPLVVTVDDDDVHRSHFSARSIDAGARPAARYSAGFDNIRRVQRYIKSQALSHGVPVIRNYNLDQALAAVIDLVVQRATERTDVLSASTERPVPTLSATKGR